MCNSRGVTNPLKSECGYGRRYTYVRHDGPTKCCKALVCCRIDMDYSSRRIAQKIFKVIDPDFYEWETHILFDDAFELGDNDEEEQIVNQFVKMLVRVIDEAGSFVHCKVIKV